MPRVSLRHPGRPLIVPVLLFLVAAGAVIGIRSRTQQPGAGPGLDDPVGTGCDNAPDCAASGGRRAGRGSGSPELKEAEVCPSTGYLCSSLERYGVVRVRRWLDGHERLVVHVPELPITGLDARTARELREAAIRGILAWNGRPLPIVVDRQGLRPADFSIRWRIHLTGANTSLGRERWTEEAGLRFEYLELAYERNDGRALRNPQEIEIGAVQEMGHALGLEWSDSERDVMYPVNTVTRPSARDFQTVAALYALPNGAFIFP